MISRDEVLRIARLAKLKLTEAEVEMFQEQLGRILEYFKRLQELDTSNVEPMEHVLDVHNVLREDEPKEPVSQEDALKNSPKRRDGFFEVPKVI